MYEARCRQTTGIKKRGLLLDLNCLPSQVARLIVRGFSRILLFARFPSLGLGSSPLSLFFPLRSSFSLFLFLFSPVATHHPRFHKPRLGTPWSHTFRSRNNSAVPKFSLPPPVPTHRHSCRALVIMRGEPCISHRCIIRNCFPWNLPPLLTPPIQFFPRLLFTPWPRFFFAFFPRFCYFPFRPTRPRTGARIRV